MSHEEQHGALSSTGAANSRRQLVSSKCSKPTAKHVKKSKLDDSTSFKIMVGWESKSIDQSVMKLTIIFKLENMIKQERKYISYYPCENRTEANLIFCS